MIYKRLNLECINYKYAVDKNKIVIRIKQNHQNRNNPKKTTEKLYRIILIIIIVIQLFYYKRSFETWYSSISSLVNSGKFYFKKNCFLLIKHKKNIYRSLSYNFQYQWIIELIFNQHQKNTHITTFDSFSLLYNQKNLHPTSTN